MQTIQTCKVCGCDDLRPFLTLRDHSITGETFTIVECFCCGLLHTNPVPPLSDLGKYYQSEDYISHSDTRKGFISTLYHWARTYTLTKKYAWVYRYSKGKRLLDVGCGTGYFATHMQQSGYDVQAMEPDPGARQKAEELLKMKVSDSLENVTGTYDAITLWHVLEHVPDINDTFVKLIQRLDQNGRLFIAIPNPASYDASVYKEYWAAYDVPRHLFHITPKVMDFLARRHNLQVVASIPQKMDSYYISLLSEKYKKGSLWKAFWIGLISNIKGGASNTSSMLYVLKKKP